MPTYEYVCRGCGHRFERFQKISDEPTRECPECGEQAVERLISAGAGLLFKGPGFYATDYRKGTLPGETSTEGGVEEGRKEGTEKGKNVKETGSGPEKKGK